MIVLGIHMGHDAAVTIVADGRIVSLIERERRTRIKHAAIATVEDIDAALADAGLSVSEIDAVAVSTTQNWPLLFTQPDRFHIRYAADAGDRLRVPADMESRWQTHFGQMADLERTARQRLVNFTRFPDTRDLFDAETREAVRDKPVLFTQQFPMYPRAWAEAGHSAEIERVGAEFAGKTDWRRLLIGPFHAPLMVTLDGHEIPGALVPHHLAHAATAFYGSDAESAAILTHDGGHEWTQYGYTGGVHCLGEGDRLYPIWMNHAVGGNLYRRVADACGLSGMGGPGKLMGLAPYGTPRFHDEAWIGTGPDLEDRFPAPKDRMVVRLYERGWPYIRAAVDQWSAQSGKSQPIPARDPLSEFGRDLAASVQATFEAQTLASVATLDRLAKAFGVATDTLCLTGGCALNCPANSLVWREGPFDTVFVPPTCDDSGLAIGAAFYLAHTVFDDKRVAQGAATNGSAYLGRRIGDAELDTTLADAARDFRVEEGLDAATAAADDLASGKVIAWVEGRSEIGPRALGHRSLLADPRAGGNWRGVNILKSREQWRPLAPAVLQEKAGDWFDGAPAVSPHMLFTYSVTDSRIPAVTHVDRSARVQTVDASAGLFRDLVAAFDAATGVPVVMNTSLNGRGEPIVETPDEALALFRRTPVDALYLEGRRITRKTD